MSFSLLKLNSKQHQKSLCVECKRAIIIILVALIWRTNKWNAWICVCAIEKWKKWFSTEYAAKSNIIIYCRSKYVCVLVFFVFDFFCSFFSRPSMKWICWVHLYAIYNSAQWFRLEFPPFYASQCWF